MHQRLGSHLGMLLLKRTFTYVLIPSLNICLCFMIPVNELILLCLPCCQVDHILCFLPFPAESSDHSWLLTILSSDHLIGHYYHLPDSLHLHLDLHYLVHCNNIDFVSALSLGSVLACSFSLRWQDCPTTCIPFTARSSAVFLHNTTYQRSSKLQYTHQCHSFTHALPHSIVPCAWLLWLHSTLGLFDIASCLSRHLHLALMLTSIKSCMQNLEQKWVKLWSSFYAYISSSVFAAISDLGWS